MWHLALPRSHFVAEQRIIARHPVAFVTGKLHTAAIGIDERCYATIGYIGPRGTLYTWKNTPDINGFAAI